MPNFTKTLNLEKPLRGEFYSIEKHNENSDKIDLAIAKITVPTTEHLKNMIELQVGDIVDIQGYYTAGDGAHHKRKIESNDDGSGVQLVNGLWANIVHSGEVNVSWFGVKVGLGVETSGMFNTDVIDKAILYAKNNCDILSFPSGYINITSILIDNFSDKTINFNNTVLMGRSSINREGVLVIKGFSGSSINGDVFIHGNTSELYECGLYIYSEEGNNTAYSSFSNITIGYAKLALKIGKNASDDSLLSENNFHDIKTLFCAKALEFNGSQNVNTFVNCQFVTGGKTVEDIFGYGDDLNCITVNGGAPTFVGGEIVAHTYNATGSSLLSVNPFESSTYGRDYPKVVISSVHIETGKKLFTVNNNGGNGRTATINFSNCGGFSYLKSESNFCEILDPSYDGLIRIKDCNFYSHTRPRVAINLYSLSDVAKLDIDTSSFTTGFVQGKAGIVGGILRGSNSEAVSCTLESGSYDVGKVKLIRGTIYNPNYQNIITDGEIIIPRGCRAITISGFIQRTNDSDLVVRRNTGNYYYIMNAKSNISCIIPVKSGDVISIYSYSSTNIINSHLQILLDVDFEYATTSSLEEMFYNPLIVEESKRLGIYADYVAYRDELFEYEQLKNSATDEVMLMPVLQEPVIPESIKAFAEKYNII